METNVIPTITIFKVTILPHFVLRLVLHFYSLIFFLKNEFYFQGGLEEELIGGFNEIMTKEKKSNNNIKSVSRGKRLKKQKNFHSSEESDEEKQDYSERLSEDRESVPQGSSEEREVDERSGALWENSNGDEESDSGGHQHSSDAGSSPREMEKSHTEPSKSPHDDDDTSAEISDEVPLVNNSAVAALMLFSICSKLIF